ncbi:MAG: serine/threonine protein kinase, partial [Planctomycetota bacterium]
MSRELTLHKGLIGKNLGKIKILSVLGQGGMGIVFKGVHELLEKEVAVKILPFSPMMPSSGRDRFLREARLAAKLEHPNIVQVYDVEQGPAFDYIVMQFVEGCSLAELIHQKGTLEFDEVLYLLRQTLEGMAFAHSKGIVHRDIKPANILITKEGQAKIADFGLSRNLVSETLTESGIVMGTPEYMAPEQAHGEEVDGRADIYSLAITFYHALTGTLPFTGSRPLKIIMNKLDKKLPLVHQKMSEIPPSFSVILQKMAHPDVSLRYSSCREIFSDLEKIILPSMPKISQKLATMTMEIQKSRLEIQREEEASEKNTSAYDYLEILSGVQLRGNLEAQVEGEHENKRLAEKLSNKYHLILSCCAIVFLLLLGWYFLFSLPQQKEYKRLFREAQKAFQEGRYYQAKTLAHIIQSEYQNTPEIKAFLQKIESRNPYQYYLEKAKMAYQKGKFLQA